MQILTAEEMARLTPQEKADLIDQLWASWDQESLILSEAQLAELNNRLEDLKANPADEMSWEELKIKLRGNDHEVV
ncbi:MAG: addiction module protein [Burkholderiales bacterium]